MLHNNSITNSFNHDTITEHLFVLCHIPHILLMTDLDHGDSTLRREAQALLSSATSNSSERIPKQSSSHIFEWKSKTYVTFCQSAFRKWHLQHLKIRKQAPACKDLKMPLSPWRWRPRFRPRPFSSPWRQGNKNVLRAGMHTGIRCRLRWERFLYTPITKSRCQLVAWHINCSVCRVHIQAYIQNIKTKHNVVIKTAPSSLQHVPSPPRWTCLKHFLTLPSLSSFYTHLWTVSLWDMYLNSSTWGQD